MDTEKYNTSIEYRAFDTTVDVIFIDTAFPISNCQQRNLDNFKLQQDSFTSDILNKVFDFYKTSYANYKEGWTYGNELNEEEIERYLPTPTSPEVLKTHFTPLTIYIPDKNKCKDGYIGISFDCTWDIKSGLGVLIKDWEVVEVSVSEVSFIYF